MSDDIWGWLRLAMNCLSCVGGGLVVWGVWSFKKSFVSHEKCTECRKEITDKSNEDQKETDTKVSGHGERLASIERALCDLPSKDSLHKIELSLSEMGGDLKAMKTLVEKIDITVDRRESILMNGDK